MIILIVFLFIFYLMLTIIFTGLHIKYNSYIWQMISTPLYVKGEDERCLFLVNVFWPVVFVILVFIFIFGKLFKLILPLINLISGKKINE